MEKFNYWHKIENLEQFSDLAWNIPEQKTGTINIIGGNSNNFANVIRTAEFLLASFPIKNLSIILPDVLQNKLPTMPNLVFLPSTDSGSLAKSSRLNDFVATADFSLLIGDLSKNSATTIALSDAIKQSSQPVLLTRDSIDLLLPEMNNIIERKNLFIVGSVAQLQKLLRSVYYPKMLLLSMPLVSAIEVLHKFTLSYQTTILTFHQNQIIIAANGEINTFPIEKSSFTPISLWNGQLAAKIAANNLFSPGQTLAATTFSIS